MTAPTPNPYIGLAGTAIQTAGSFYSTYQTAKSEQKKLAQQQAQFEAEMGHNSRVQDFEEKKGSAEMENQRKQIESTLTMDNLKALEMLSEGNRTQNHVISMFKAFNNGVT